MTTHNPDNRKTPRPDKRTTQTGQTWTPASDQRADLRDIDRTGNRQNSAVYGGY